MTAGPSSNFWKLLEASDRGPPMIIEGGIAITFNALRRSY